MYSELIYTRCGEGIDILKGGTPIKNSGFKVYSCSREISEDGFADIQFLFAMAQSKESYSDPSFMDDAYLYYVPDIGAKCFLDFHPIPFDRNATGDYSHRPGNFINQIFLGSYHDFYPYELFGCESVWDAKKRGEAFYYENAPVPLMRRDHLERDSGYLGYQEIASFVADGRREALMSAVAFIISQYSLKPEERKYLVIRDADSRLIELWIAAIENAFSPRMASGLSFATRLDKFVNANKYTVNLNGQYQTQINLQNPNQKVRFRAMIVGVDERDKNNAAMVKPIPNAPYVVLDGKTKTLSVSMDISNPYYRYATSYDEGHKYLCREFMQMVDISSPSGGVLDLYNSFIGISRFRSSKSIRDLIPAITILGKYKLIRTSHLVKLYNDVKQGMPGLLKEDPVESFVVMNWLERISCIVGDNSIRDDFRESICRAYADNVYTSPGSGSTRALHDSVVKSSYVHDTAAYITSQKTVASYYNTLCSYRANDWIAFSELFVESKKILKDNSIGSVSIILQQSINSLYASGDMQSAAKVALLYNSVNPGQVLDILFSEASKSPDQNYASFLIRLICRISPDAIASSKNLENFYRHLQKYNMSDLFSVVLEVKADSLSRPQDMERFVDWILGCRELAGVSLASTVKTIDAKMVLSNKEFRSLAAKIQSCRPEGVICINSAHIFAIDVLDDRRRVNEWTTIFNSLVQQWFPSIKDESYADRLAKKVCSQGLPQEVFRIIMSAASQSPLYSAKIVNEAFRSIGSKQDSVIGEILEIAVQTNSKVLFDALVSACADIKQFDRGMIFISGTVRSEPARQYFAIVEREARSIHDQKKGPSLIGRLFTHRPTDDSGN
ncbi:hypothetical protein SAMN02910456_01221 [Ruminococcaceae bacterium YRB3002]|nr:hypothetical protein SAMN02910456_01221 [Ruminococcaceae bacterium YRB3002]